MLQFFALPGLAAANNWATWTFPGGTPRGAHHSTAMDMAGTDQVPAAPTGRVVTETEITSFSGANDSFIAIDGVRAHVHNANQSWSLTSPDSRTLRFEVHPGDHWSNSRFSDLLHNSGSERSEIAIEQQYKSGAVINLSYRFMIEAGPKNTSPWLVIGQFHQTAADGPPPFAVAMYGEHMYIIIRDHSRKENDIYADPNPIKRGQYYSMSIQVKFDDMKNGALNVWRDGVPIVSYRGTIGYGENEAYYWKQGIYRGRGGAETIAVNYQDLRVTAVPSALPQE
ncbi:heparin lyase I family protein [Bradyrhizobium sp. JYMT SZCCT0180]|uniref:heparin lyase I family protein n=1 Tax=Bradyrhizobium sp. JYMT SZCCT0180 TaxID=2807666 RepID=UPI001BAD6BA5|nr:heparin lyase I family protein [Bradyrhizobium sp. JYMT SZCCT0180]MBR1213952.1 heparin lyase I family protein [Bradyrhizobium sp. JYMT SZCCT0180]